MGKVAKDPSAPRPDLPAGQDAGSPGAPAVRPASTGTLTYGLRVREVLEVSTLAGARLLAGSAGLDRVVQRLNVMEVPDILPWVKPNELLLTTGYPLRHTPQALADLVSDLDERGLSALAIKLHRYIDELPPQMLERADRLGFPIIELPDGVAFDDILNQVLTDVLNRQAAVLARSEEVHRALVQIVLAGGGIRELAGELVELLGGAVFVTSPEGHVLAGSGAGERLATLREGPCFTADGRLTLQERPYGLRYLPGAPLLGAVVPIVAGALDCGRIVAFAGGRGLGPDDVHTLERAATVAALAITKQLAVSAVESKYQGDFLHDLLNGRVGDAGQATQRAASLGWDIDRPLVVVLAELDPAPGGVVAELDQRRLQERFTEAWTSAVRARDRRAAVVGFSRDVVTVLGAQPGAEGEGRTDRLVREIVQEVAGQPALARRTFSTGVSRMTGTPDGLPAAYEQARQAVVVGRQMRGAGAVTDFDGLGVFRLLSLVPDSDELDSFVAETLGELADRDDPEAADLRRTLQVLLETNGNVAETARQLHFHYNTLRYRIGKLERMLGPFTSDPNLRLSLSLALHVVQTRG
jgi:PucR family transcriptional regulator, purine catabolism regulatory protein